MNPEPNFNRFHAVLMGEQPDRVPNAEVLISQDVKEVILGKKITTMKEEVEFWTTTGYDYVPIVAGLLGPGRITDASKIFQVVKRSLFVDNEEQEEWAVEGKGVINTVEEFERFPWTDYTTLDYSKFHEIQPHLTKNVKIVVVGGKIFTIVWMLMGFEGMCLSLIKDPQLVSSLFSKIGEMQLAALDKAISYGNVGALWLVDDIAFNTGLMISPKYLRKYLFPWYKEMIRLCNKKDIPTIYHSDGNIWEVIPDIIEIGAKAFHPIEPKAMDINEVKEKTKGKLALLGNIDVDHLVRKEKSQIISEVMDRLSTVSKGGAYCLGSSNSIPNWINIENYKAMLETNEKYGSYPISI